jgi:hypothetical protein
MTVRPILEHVYRARAAGTRERHRLAPDFVRGAARAPPPLGTPDAMEGCVNPPGVTRPSRYARGKGLPMDFRPYWLARHIDYASTPPGIGAHGIDGKV